jgi:predicted phosphodiesterase
VKLGILSDIHEANVLLTEAIGRLQRLGVDRFVVLGDLFETGREISKTVALLTRIGAVGVFGNHELGLVINPDEHLRKRYGDDVLSYFATLHGQHREGDCLFSHAQAWMDPTDIEQPWYLHGLPNQPDLLPQNFAATPCRVLFQGHYHRWLAATPEGTLGWSGDGPLRLELERRYLVVIHAVCNGWCARYDTATGVLEPIHLWANNLDPSRVLPI